MSATADHFAAWERRAKRMTYDALVWSSMDAREARDTTAGFDSERSAMYADELGTYLAELTRRGPTVGRIGAK